MRSSRKPYIGWEGPRNFFVTPSRHLKESNAKESSFEKPYDVSNYNLMHQEPNLPKVPDGALNPGGIEVSFVDGACSYGIKAIAGITIPTIGGPEEDKAGWLEPSFSQGGMVGFKISGTGNRSLDIVLNESLPQHTVLLQFKDGWGMLHSVTVVVACTELGWYYLGANSDVATLKFVDPNYTFIGGESRSWLEIGYSTDGDGYTIEGCFRFPNIDIPQNAAITAAKLALWHYPLGTSQCYAKLYANAADAAVAPTDVVSYQALAKTTAYITPIFPEAAILSRYYESNDCKTVIQEVISRVGWSKNNALALMIVPTLPTLFSLYFYTYKAGIIKAPKLFLTYYGEYVAPAWAAYFDNTYWVAATGSWSTDHWTSEEVDLGGVLYQAIYITPINSWEVAFRPTKFRLTHNCVTPIVLSIAPAVFDSEAYTSGTEEDITLANDISYILALVPTATGAFDITNIEFYS